MFPIKYIENNLVFNHDGECFSYYELTPYNYSFLSPEEKYMVHDNFRQLIAQNRDGKIHALQIATEDSLRAVQERSKKGITGRLRDVACAKIDEQTEALVEMIGENQIDYRFFLGFKLLVNEEEINLKSIRKSAAMTFADFLYEVNHKLMGDFVSMSNDEINRFMKMEKLLESKISRRFQFRRLDKNDFGYLLEHIYGNTGIAYNDYSYELPVIKLLVQYKKDQQELKEFLGSAYNDYNLVIALENGNPVESRIVRDRFQKLCEENDFEIVVFHSLRHLSTGYKLKMTNGDVKSVQGDTGHAEAEMVTDVYSKIIDEDRRFNAQKMDKEFYSTLDEDTSNQQQDTGISDSDMELLKLLKSLSPEMKEQLLKQTLNK